MYYFGIYHWRRERWRLAGATLLFAVGVLFTILWPSFAVVGGAIGAVGVAYGLYRGRKLFQPWPFGPGPDQYDLFRRALDFEDAVVLDVGAGTGRTLVTMAQTLHQAATVIALDVYTSDIILGNTPARTRRNLERAGLEPAILRGNGQSLPVQSDAVDVVFLTRILHDLDPATNKQILEACHDVLNEEGHLALYELPVGPVEGDPVTYWIETVTAAGFTVERAEALAWKRDREAVALVARPA